MTAHPSPAIPASIRSRSASRARTAWTVVAGVVVASGANSVVVLAALDAGADPAFPPLMPAIYGAFTAVGIAAGFIGWRVIRNRARSPRRVLLRVVPILLLLSFVPDVVSMLAGFIPGGSVTGWIALMIMHPIVVAVGVPIYQRIAPVS